MLNIPPEKFHETADKNAIIAQFLGYSIDDSQKFFNGIHYYKMENENDKYENLTIENVRSYTSGWIWNYLSLTEKRYDNDWNRLIDLLYVVQDAAYDIWDNELTDDRMHIKPDFLNKEVSAVDADTGLYILPIEKSEDMMLNLYNLLVNAIIWINSKKN